MALSTRQYWLFGIVGSGLAIAASCAVLLQPHVSEASNVEVVTAVDRSMRLHTAGIQKALQGDYADAIVDYDLALQLTPNHPEMYYNRGVAHYSVGKTQLALNDFDRAIELQPTMAEAFANRGMIRLEIGDRDGAIADGQQAAHLFLQQNQPSLSQEMQVWIEQMPAP